MRSRNNCVEFAARVDIIELLHFYVCRFLNTVLERFRNSPPAVVCEVQVTIFINYQLCQL